MWTCRMRAVVGDEHRRGGAAERRPRWCLLPQGACPAGMHPPLSSSQSPLNSVSACGENCARSLAPPLPTARGAARAPYLVLPKEKRAVHGPKRKALARSGAVALRAHGGRRIGACSDFAWPSGTLDSSTGSILPSRGGWCPGRRGARTHLTSSSFRAFRFATRCPGIRRSCCLALCCNSHQLPGQRQRKEKLDISRTSLG